MDGSSLAKILKRKEVQKHDTAKDSFDTSAERILSRAGWTGKMKSTGTHAWRRKNGTKVGVRPDVDEFSELNKVNIMRGEESLK